MMLRVGGAIVALLTIAGGITVLCTDVHMWPIALELIVFGVLLLAGSTFERWRYRKPVDNVAANFAPTGEVFDDPVSGERVTVMYDAATGEREYRKTT
jgi:hypothetical protein